MHNQPQRAPEVRWTAPRALKIPYAIVVGFPGIGVTDHLHHADVARPLRRRVAVCVGVEVGGHEANEAVDGLVKEGLVRGRRDAAYVLM